MKGLFLSAIFAVSFASLNAFAAGECANVNPTDAASVTAADKDCATKGEVCILAKKMCGKPQAKGESCIRDQVCHSGKCDGGDAKTGKKGKCS